MIIVDIPMPKRCMDCPFSYLIMSGKCEGMTMCNAMEARDNERIRFIEESVTYDPMRYVIDETAKIKPTNCPIVGEVRRNRK